MKKLFAIALILLMSGCTSFSSGKELNMGEQVWWGSKKEIIKFLDSPEAKADKWMIQDIESIS